MSTDKPKYKTSHDDNSSYLTTLSRTSTKQSPNPAWASNCIYIKVNVRNNYMYVVSHLFSRRIIGWHTASSHNTDLTITTFKKTYEIRRCPLNILFHSDRGSEYTGLKFCQLMDKCNWLQPFSKKGDPYGNAYLENFFKQMKREELNPLTPFLLQIRRMQYHNRRPHSSLGNLTLTEVEDIYRAGQK